MANIIVDRLAPVSWELFCTEVFAKGAFLFDNVLVKSLMSFFMVMYSWLFIRPLANIYIYGPRWSHFGFFAGMKMEDICSEITTVGAAHWIENREKCLEIIDIKFQGFLLVVQYIIVLFLLYKFVCVLWYLYIVQPANLKAEKEKIELKLRLEHTYNTRKENKEI